MTYNGTMNYQDVITETREYLLQLERETKDAKARDRVRFVRLLKTGEATTQQQAGALVGLGVRQSQRLWQKYWQAGIELMSRSNYKGGKSKLDKEQEQQFVKRLKEDDIQSLEQARAFLKQQCGASYTIGGVSAVCQRLRVKLKTGRPTNVKQNKEELEEFKKKSIQP